MNRKNCYLLCVFKILAVGRVIILVGLCVLFTDLNTMMAQDYTVDRTKHLDMDNYSPWENPIDVELRYNEHKLNLYGHPCFHTREIAKSYIQETCKSRQDKTTSKGALAYQAMEITVNPGEEKTIVIYCLETTALIDYLNYYCGGL